MNAKQVYSERLLKENKSLKERFEQQETQQILLQRDVIDGQASGNYANVSKNIFLRFLNSLNLEWNYTQFKFIPGTVEKNETSFGPPAGIKSTYIN